MLIKTSELTGAALDWAVAKCKGWNTDLPWDDRTKPSTNWSQGGPIIERENIILLPPNTTENLWIAGSDYGYDWMVENEQTGNTPLIAAMRCYVASILGDTVEILNELL